MTNKMKVSIVILTKNEENSVRDVINGCKKFADEIIVVDGNSEDNTREVAERCGAKILIDNGKGKGAGMRLGIEKAFGDILVFIDGDGSHNPNDIPGLISPIIGGEADMVIGSRLRAGSDELRGNFSNFIRRISNNIVTLAISYRWNVKLSDSQNGFKAIKHDVVRKLNLTENIFTIEQEMIMKCLKKGFMLKEVPAYEYARKYGKSRIIIRKVWHRYLWCLVKNLFLK